MKRIFDFILLLLCAIILSGCSSKRLEKAFLELEENNYTVVMEMNMNISTTFAGETNSESTSMTTKMESDENYLHSVVVSDDLELEYFYIIDEEQVSYYQLHYSKWDLLGRINIENFNENEIKFIDVDTNLFKNKFGTWKGDTDKLSEQLSEYMKEAIEEIVGAGMTFNEISVNKYDIKLKGGSISTMEIEVSYKMSLYGMNINAIMNVVYNFSDIGTTKVEVPEGIN